MIFTNLAPNVSFRDLGIVSSFFLLPWKWHRWYTGRAQERVKLWFQDYLHTEHVYLTDSGRSALYLGLQAMHIGEGDEVLVPAYTCIVVTNAIRATGATPIVVDIDQDLNVNESLLRAAVTPKTKAILAQHTFGLPVDVHEIRDICNEYNLYMIEDCAHALGSHVGDAPVGSFGDISFFSFGSDKVVSSVRGGALVVHNKAFSGYADELASALPKMPKRTLWKHITYVSAFAKTKSWYTFGGKFVLYALRKLGITAQIIEPAEKDGYRASWTPAVYPNLCAALLLPQLRKLYSKKVERRAIAQIYLADIPNVLLLDEYRHDTDRTYLHFPILVDSPTKLNRYIKSHGVQVGMDWNGEPILPTSAKQHDVFYADIPVARTLSKKVVQLPIHQRMTKKKAEKVVSLINTYLKTHAND